jgi:hypothetical protein
MTEERRRVLIAWDVGAHGIWRVLTKEEKEAPAKPGTWSGIPPRDLAHRPRPWRDQLSNQLLHDLQEWNDAWDTEAPDSQALQERGRELAARVQDELGTDDWEVLYQIGGRMHRVHPPGSWPIRTWEQELLGYQPRMPDPEPADHMTGGQRTDSVDERSGQR